MELTLPKPNEHELSKWNKADYFNRIYSDHVDIKNKNRIESNVFADWIHHTYESWIHHNKPVTYNEYKKLIR